MSRQISIHLRDLGEPLVAAWRREFASAESVTVSCGDIFTDQPGPLKPGAPIDITADAIVSPANSFGFMDGGIDGVYTHQFGDGLQTRLQQAIATEHDGELPIGQALVVPTGHRDIPWCISAPTMRTPCDVSQTVNAFLAFRAALQAVLRHNESDNQPIESVLCPGLGTAIGRMPVQSCARQMRAAWDQILGDRLPYPASLRQAADDEDWLIG